MAKRGIDVAVALILLLLTLPMVVVIALLVRVSSSGPILYRQRRVGRHGAEFTIFKFRTFPVEHVPPTDVALNGVAVVPVERSPLRVGHLLRQTSMDELPQLLNVLRGDMSLVGPRPERPELASVLAASVPGYHSRHRAPVGMTGHAQILGLCGTTSISDRVAADNHYIDNWSLGRDLAILLRTIPTVIRKTRA